MEAGRSLRELFEIVCVNAVFFLVFHFVGGGGWGVGLGASKSNRHEH